MNIGNIARSVDNWDALSSFSPPKLLKRDQQVERAVAWCETTLYTGPLWESLPNDEDMFQTEGEFPRCLKAVFILQYVAGPADEEVSTFVE